MAGSSKGNVDEREERCSRPSNRSSFTVTTPKRPKPWRSIPEVDGEEKLLERSVEMDVSLVNERS